MNPLLRMNVDQANWALREGMASKANAEEFVNLWNNGGAKVSTRCYVVERSRPVSGGEVVYPLIICESWEG